MQKKSNNRLNKMKFMNNQRKPKKNRFKKNK